MKKEKPGTPISLYIPNLVGYVRLCTLLWGLLIVKDEPLYGFLIILFSGLLDALDGFLARYLNQSTEFGAILDYSLDRVAVASYFFILTFAYPNFWLIFCLLLNCDIASHLFHLKSSSYQKKASHKEVSKEDPLMIRLYYSSRAMLFMTCLTHDLFLASLFLYKYYPNVYTIIGMAVTLPGFVFKTVVHIIKIVRASKAIIYIEQEQ